MVSLFDQEKIWEIERYNIARDAKQQGLQEGQAALILKLLKKFSVVDVSEMIGIPEVEIARLVKQ